MSDKTTHMILKVPVPAGLAPVTAELVRQVAFSLAEELHAVDQAKPAKAAIA